MTRFWTIVIVVLLVTLLGGAFWYAKASQSQTVFQSQQKSIKDQALVVADTPARSDEVTSVPENTTAEDEKKNTTVVATEENKSEAPEETKNNTQKNDTGSEDKEVKNFAIKSALVSFGHESATGRKIDTVVLHSSYSTSGDAYSVSGVRSLWQSYGVSPHYMIARDGTVYQLVADKDIAYHAGESQMKDGRKNVNDFSIGVEILNTKDDEYTKAQYQAVKDLIAYLKGKYSIKYVVGHDDIAPGRKTDPWNFDWNKI